VNQATLLLTLFALLLCAATWRKGSQELKRGLQLGVQSLLSTAPLLLIAFIIVGYITVLLPQSLIQDWVGPNSGLQGLVLGEVAGVLLPGGPYVVFPLIASLYQAGAGIGPTLAMIVSWAGLALISITFEIPFLGWRFSLIRVGLSLLVPFLAGFIGMLILGS
jgi:uncharacterized membrane protein YraQ (UPF0718 family)